MEKNKCLGCGREDVVLYQFFCLDCLRNGRYSQECEEEFSTSENYYMDMAAEDYVEEAEENDH